MTLRDLLCVLNLTVDCPFELGYLIVKNEEDFCRYALKNYFMSPKFKDDLAECYTTSLLVKNEVPKFFLLTRNEEGFTLYLSIGVK